MTDGMALRIALFALILWPAAAQAHVSEQGFVLLLPTDVYIFSGAAVVALTVVALFALPARLIERLFAWRIQRGIRPPEWLTIATSVGSFVFLAALVAIGLAGPHGPLENILPLSFWTLGWIGLVSLSGFMGNLWAWTNPWTGLYRLIAPKWKQRPLPEQLGLWPAWILLLAFAAFLLADIAPDDPARLAIAVAVYWCLTMIGLLVFGPAWLRHFELGHAIMTTYARLAPWKPGAPAGLGGPGWQVVAAPEIAGAGVFALTLLAVGSFDGINETFWWLAQIGVNPLEFPGRSAVIGETLVGLGAAIALLIAVFAMTVRAGLFLAGTDVAFPTAFGRLALTILPIALVYHLSHYLTSFLVNIQHTLAAFNDPLDIGADLFGIEPFHVTTGFFNHLDWVRAIWLSQAGLVVLGHVWSVLLSHRIAQDLFGDNARASRATLPLSLFMIAYTFLGLWLLAAPKGA